MPAILGLPALAGTFITAVTSFVAWIVSKVTLRVTVILAAVAAMGAVTVTVISAIRLLIEEAVSSVSPEIMTGLYFIPSNINHCIGLVLGAHTSLIVYDMSMRVINMKIQVAK